MIEWGAKPNVFYCNCGPEYVSGALLHLATKQQICIEYIQPVKPQQNADVERFIRTVHYYWLGQYAFESIEKNQREATVWLRTYNNERPNMTLGGITPMQKLAMAA